MIGLEPIWKNSEGFSYYSMSPQPHYALQSGLCLCHNRSFRQVVYSLYTFNTTPVVYLARRSLNSSPNQPPFIWNFRLHMLYFYVVKIKVPCVCLFHHIPMVAPVRFELAHTDLKGRRVYHFTKTPQLNERNSASPFYTPPHQGQIRRALSRFSVPRARCWWNIWVTLPGPAQSALGLSAVETFLCPI